jgi:hypothetical protein
VRRNEKMCEDLPVGIFSGVQETIAWKLKFS